MAIHSTTHVHRLAKYLQNMTDKAMNQIFETMREIQAFYKSFGLCDFGRIFEFF